MFLKILNKVNNRALKQTQIIVYYCLQFAKLFELLATDHSSSERRIIFDLRLLKFSHVPVAL